MLAVGYQLITYELLARNTVRHWDMDRPAVWRRHVSWWRHQMETFSALLAICAGNSPVSSEFPTQRPVTRSFDVFFDLCRNKRLSKQSLGWWLETPSRSLWRHRNVLVRKCYNYHTLRPRQNGHHLADIFKCIFFNENIWISNMISLKCVTYGLI